MPKTALPKFYKKVILTGLCAFGGLSSVAQTAGVLIGADLSIKKYIVRKICQSFVAIIIAFIVFSILV